MISSKAGAIRVTQHLIDFNADRLVFQINQSDEILPQCVGKLEPTQILGHVVLCHATSAHVDSF